jgi:hypothetical protein
VTSRVVSLVLAVSSAIGADASASGHGPVFGAATPTLGRGGWSVDQAYTFRAAEDADAQQMFKTMVSFGVTEALQVSVSIPVVMHDGLAPSRMMSAMSSEREVEGLLAYRFQKRTVGVGGRQESTLYVGGTVPTEDVRSGVPVGPSISVQAATGYVSRAHYVWVGGGVQHFPEHDNAQQGDSRFLTFVYGYRPPPLRVEAGKPDLRFFVEVTGENRTAARIGDSEVVPGIRSVFVGPTSLLVYKAIAIEGGILFPFYLPDAQPRERFRAAVNVAYFFWLR